jgi:mono/diheme cytochrome c family protein
VLVAVGSAWVERAHGQRVTYGRPPSWDAGRYSETAAAPSAIGLSSTRDPALDYDLNCRGCHRADGSGTDGAVPALAGSVARFLSVPGGREYLTRVPGVAQSVLDDAALAALLNWLLLRFDPQHVPISFVPFTAAEMAAHRDEPLVRTTETRQRLLAAMR